ncbi:MAG: alpha/beta hydrolase, partial [Bacteroidetes bacterium]|nr:alpha/beta hydrolase [Bacteroidota bacterium]
MKKLLSIIAIVVISKFTFCQSMAGVTGVPDTSFSVQSEFRKLIKYYPGIKTAEDTRSDSITAKKNIVYCTIGERKLVLDVFKPSWKSKNKRVCIIIVHGGGWRSGNRSIHYPLAERLALLGYVCFTPEYRLSTEALYPSGVNDIKAAIRWVKANAKQFNIDTTKIAIAGHSAG